MANPPGQPELRAPAPRPPADPPVQPAESAYVSPYYQGRNPRTFGPRALPPDKLAKRYAYLERIGRRCDGGNRRCHQNAAKVEFRVRDVDPATGQPTGEPYTLKSCTPHRNSFERNTARYQVLAIRELPPAPGQGAPQGGRR